MTLYGTLALLCWIGFFGSILWGLTTQYKIVEAINSKQPSEEPLDMFANRFRRITDFKVWSLYKRHFPEGKLVRNYWVFTAAGFFWLALALVFLVHAVDHAAP